MATSQKLVQSPCQSRLRRRNTGSCLRTKPKERCKRPASTSRSSSISHHRHHTWITAPASPIPVLVTSRTQDRAPITLPPSTPTCGSHRQMLAVALSGHDPPPVEADRSACARSAENVQTRRERSSARSMRICDNAKCKVQARATKDENLHESQIGAIKRRTGTQMP
jgi:hypothetical protein